MLIQVIDNKTFKIVEQQCRHYHYYIDSCDTFMVDSVYPQYKRLTEGSVLYLAGCSKDPSQHELNVKSFETMGTLFLHMIKMVEEYDEESITFKGRIKIYDYSEI